MAKKKRPAFNLPSTKDAASVLPAEWVYRTDRPKRPEKRASSRSPVMMPEPVSQLPPAQAEPMSHISARATAPALIITKHCRYASAVGLIPIPLVDIAAMTAVRVNMVAELAAHYGLDFDRQFAKSLVASIVAAISGRVVAFRVARQLLRAVPSIGTAARLIVEPMSAYGATWTVGQLFDQHFAKGGTLFDFDASKGDSAQGVISS